MGKQPFEIIGIVGDIRHRALESNPFPAMYMPSNQTGVDEYRCANARGSGKPCRRCQK